MRMEHHAHHAAMVRNKDLVRRTAAETGEQEGESLFYPPPLAHKPKIIGRHILTYNAGWCYHGLEHMF
jgi:hypothetical protein